MDDVGNRDRLAALWLTIAMLEGWPALFGGFQAALGFVWFFGAGAWLTPHGWDWREPFSLQIYALGLGLLSLGWELDRRSLQGRRNLLTPAFVPIDQWITGGLVLGQLVLAGTVVLWSVARELSFAPDAWRVFPAEWHQHAFSIWAWLVLVPLAGIAVVRLRNRDLTAPLIGCTLLALTLPLLAAGTWFDGQKASASALRWGLVLCCGVVSLGLWKRHRLGAELSVRVPALAIHALMAGGVIVPVLAITVIVAATRLAGQLIPGPEAGIFEAMHRPASLLIPLALLIATLAGHGFRERLTHYLFGAGLLMAAGSVGGYFLALQRIEIDAREPWVVVGALLLAAGTMGTWTIVWTWIASLLETDEKKPLLDSALLLLHGTLGEVLYTSVLVEALSWIVFRAGDPGRIWTQMTGSVWGWLAFGTLAFGSCFLAWKRRGSLPLHLLGVLSLTGVGVIACSVEIFWRDQSFVALMFGAGVFACVWVWSHLFLDGKPRPAVAEPRRASVGERDLRRRRRWGRGSARLCDVRDQSASGVVGGGHRPGGAGVRVARLSAQGGVVAVARRTARDADEYDPRVTLRQGQSQSLVAGDPGQSRSARNACPRAARTTPLSDDGRRRGSAPLATAATDRGRNGGDRRAPVLRSRGAGVRAGPSRRMAFSARKLGRLAGAGDECNCRGLVRPRGLVHALAIGGLMLGVVLAGTAEDWLGGLWTAHHVLTLAWTLLGLIVLVLSWVGNTQIAIGPQFWPAEHRTRWADALRRCFPESASRMWVTFCGAFVVALALRAASAEPWWSVGNTCAVSILLGALAIWTRMPIYVYGSGLLFNVIGLLLFSAWSSHRFNVPVLPVLAQDLWLSYFALTQILSFAAAAMVWSLVECKLVGKGVDLSQGIALPFSQFALIAGIHLLAIGALLANGLHLLGDEVQIGTTLAWQTLGVLALGVMLDYWRSEFRRFARYHLYTCGLLAVGLALYGMALPNADWLRLAALLLASYVLLIVALARLVHGVPELRKFLHLAENPTGAGRWFWHVQFGTIALVGGIFLWITLTQVTLQGQVAGPMSCTIATLAAFLLVRVWPNVYPVESRQESLPHWLVLMLAPMILLETWWSFTDVRVPAFWLQRSGAGFAVVVITMLAYRFGLARLTGGTLWSAPCRWLGSILGVFSVGLLLVLLGQELVAYNPDPAVRTTPLVGLLVLAVGLAVLAMVGLALYSALTRKADPYGIEGDRRTVYVYLTELLFVGLLAHVRLNVPDIFHPIIGQYWYLVVMAIALGCLALSELLAKKELPILAVPIRHSVIGLAFLPVLAFRFGFLAAFCEPIVRVIPGLDPFLKYLRGLSSTTLFGMDHLPMESLCWVLLGVFLGSLARLRKSANYGILAALAVNFGVWVLLGHQDATTFLERPQLWLIPLGLIILVAEFINRDHLGFWPSLSVRYVGLTCIYLSSTFEMFRELVNSNPIYPIALALLAVAGMLLGILLQVRAFLLSGFLALLIVVFTQI
ncbi:MAG: hypothetical protein EXR98_06000 [Gemmataceae bacterium]|nr:hypothetical protein [Gemmataceae bacterium]